jgi:uncharacterized protein YceH (UPF0502 family)
MTLDPVQLRVLGALIEKEIVTPEAYPLSLNSLVAACNQKSSREPVMELTEDEVRQALHTLEDLQLAAVVRDARVPKYEHRARTVLNLRRDETALICLLLLRGPQTPGELRSRADRLYSFDGLDAVENTLARLTVSSEQTEDNLDATRPLVTILPRQPGSREARYAQLLGGTIESAPVTRESHHSGPSGESVVPPLALRLAEIESYVSALQAAMLAMEERIARLEAAVPAGPSAAD